MKADKTNYWFFVVFLTIAGMLASIPGLSQDKYDRVLSLHGKWKFNIGDKSLWADPYFNDKAWESIYVPSKWEDEGFNGYNGYAWYRTSFEGAELGTKNGSYTLFLGYIDDVDEAYVNGHKIGSSGSFPPKYHTAVHAFRSYFIPSEYLNFTGKNVIAVRVFDEGGEGGIVSGEVGVYASRKDADLTVNLRGVWDFRLTWGTMRSIAFDEKSVNELAAQKEGWTDIMVPAMWETQGFPDYDGGAWYRKKFTVPKAMAGEDIVLILGKIDDTDRTFVNGKLVGQNTDAWQTTRYYHVTAQQLKPAGEANTIMVWVDDPQGNGGIFEGPVGIMKQSDFTRYLRWK